MGSVSRMVVPGPRGAQGDGAVVALDDLPGDGETQARAAGLPGTGLVHPIKAVEDPVPILLWDTDAVVADSIQTPPLWSRR